MLQIHVCSFHFLEAGYLFPFLYTSKPVILYHGALRSILLGISRIYLSCKNDKRSLKVEDCDVCAIGVDFKMSLTFVNFIHINLLYLLKTYF